MYDLMQLQSILGHHDAIARESDIVKDDVLVVIRSLDENTHSLASLMSASNLVFWVKHVLLDLES
jgi:hypothetical protein